MAAIAILNFQKIQIFNHRFTPEIHSASYCHISQRSLNPLLIYGYHYIFQDGGRPSSCILKNVIYDSYLGRQCPYTSLCQIWLKSVKWLWKYRDLRGFQNGGRRHLEFKKNQIFNHRFIPKTHFASSCQI